MTSVFVVLSAISSDKVSPCTVFTFKNLLERLLGLSKFLCFHSSLCLTCCYTGQVSRPGGLTAFEGFPRAGSSQLSQSLPLRRSPEQSLMALPWLCLALSALRAQPLLHSSQCQELQSCCSRACVPLPRAWVVAAAPAPAGSSCAPGSWRAS